MCEFFDVVVRSLTRPSQIFFVRRFVTHLYFESCLVHVYIRTLISLDIIGQLTICNLMFLPELRSDVTSLTSCLFYKKLFNSFVDLVSSFLS